MININNIKSYVINLEKYKKKYDLCLKRLSNINISPNRFNAIYIDNENDDEIKKITYPSVQYTIKNGRYAHNNIGSKGAIGCYLSHTTLWKKLLESNEDMFLIFEDDVDINENINNFNSKINNNLNLINNNDWDVIFLGYFNFNENEVNKKYTKVKNIIYGTHAYLINKKGAQKLLNNAFPIVDQIDSYMSFMAINRNVNSYMTSDVFFIQNNTAGTVIQTDHSIRPFITQYNDKLILSIIILVVLFVVLFLYLCISFRNIKN
jgi:glycosyl transferase family 25